MKAVSKVLLILSAASAMWACDRYVGPSRQTVPYVESVLAGSDQHTLGLLAASRAPLPSGSIVFIGSSADCNAFAEGFAACDERDNVDARPFPDGLGMIVSSSALQWFDDLEGFFGKCRTSLRDGGYLVFSTFGPGNLGEVTAADGKAVLESPVEKALLVEVSPVD